MCLCTFTHFCVYYTEQERDYRWHLNCSNQGKLVADLFIEWECQWLMAAQLADVHRLKGEERVTDQAWEAENCGYNLRLSLNNAAQWAPPSEALGSYDTCHRHVSTCSAMSEHGHGCLRFFVHDVTQFESQQSWSREVHEHWPVRSRKRPMMAGYV